MAHQPLEDRNLLTVQASRSHSHTTFGETPPQERSARRRVLYLIKTQHSQETDSYSSGGIRTHNPTQREATDPSLRPRDNWDRFSSCFPMQNFVSISVSTAYQSPHSSTDFSLSRNFSNNKKYKYKLEPYRR